MKKYLTFNGNLNRTPTGFCLTIFLDDRLLASVSKKRDDTVDIQVDANISNIAE